MPKGFFNTARLAASGPTADRVMNWTPRCGQCGLAKTCLTPKMACAGQGQKGILLVAEAPGELEDVKGVPLVGKSGQETVRILRRLNIDMEIDCWRTNILLCRPPKNAKPTTTQMLACRPNIFKTIATLKPTVIVLLGEAAVSSVIGSLWQERPGGITKWAGWCIPSHQLNAWICPTYHPAYLLRMNNSVLDLWFRRHLRKAFSLCDARPWDEPPDHAKQVLIEKSPSQAAVKIREMARAGCQSFAFDFETTCLKPEYPGAEIVSCAISDGCTAIAYPWHGKAIDTTLKFLESDRGKIASNLKFEDRWCKTLLNTVVQNWVWDTMLGAHLLDNRSGICGLKFQSFAVLGAPPYNAQIAPLLETRKGNKLNRIKEIDLDDLLLYNGLDSLYECMLAHRQMELLKLPKRSRR